MLLALPDAILVGGGRRGFDAFTVYEVKLCVVQYERSIGERIVGGVVGTAHPKERVVLLSQVYWASIAL